jgi:hypothetical protein
MSQVFRWTNLTLAFVLELCALAALGLWGFSVGGGPVAKTALGIGAPLCAAVLWGLFAAPRAGVRASGEVRDEGPRLRLGDLGPLRHGLPNPRPRLRIHRRRQRRPDTPRTVGSSSARQHFSFRMRKLWPTGGSRRALHAEMRFVIRPYISVFCGESS